VHPGAILYLGLGELSGRGMDCRSASGFAQACGSAVVLRTDFYGTLRQAQGRL